jgi:hypothetical protein
MMKTDLLPGGYLYRTRIGTPLGALTYAWLELLPAAAALSPLGVSGAATFVACHVAVLGLYEIGYLDNDRARTAGEPSDPARAVVSPRPASGVLAFAGVRLIVFFFVATGLAWFAETTRAAGFAAGGLMLLALVVIHTRLGERMASRSPARWIAFGWLAALKPLPALLACTSPTEAVWIALVLFVAYGAGRVLEYAVRKHGGAVRAGPLDVNACWLVAAAPAVAALLAFGPVVAPSPELAVAVLAAHHVASSVARVFKYRVQRQ